MSLRQCSLLHLHENDPKPTPTPKENRARRSVESSESEKERGEETTPHRGFKRERERRRNNAPSRVPIFWFLPSLPGRALLTSLRGRWGDAQPPAGRHVAGRGRIQHGGGSAARPLFR
eukprot:5159274-Pyramimonas_sp.AAC.1